MSAKAKILAKGSILRMVEFFAVAIVTLAMTPFILHSLGDKMYGLWVFAGSFLGYYGLMDFGLNSAVQRFLSRAIGTKDNNEANKVINTAFYVFIILGIFIFVCSFILAHLSPILIKNIKEITIFRAIVIILGFNFAVGFPMRIFYGILTANLRYEVSTAIELVKLVGRTLLIVVFLKAGYTLIALALITLFMDICGYLARYIIVNRLYPSIVFSKMYFDKTKIASLFGYSIYTFISQIADQLRFNIDNLVIIIFMGFSSVTMYSIAARIVKYFMQFISSAVGVLTPVFSQYEAIGDYESIRTKFILTTKISSYLSIMIGGIIIIFGRAFIQRWVGAKYLEAYPILIVLVVSSIFMLMQNPSIQLLYGISKHKLLTISNSIEGISNFILSLILVQKFGILGVALGTAIPMFIIKLFVQPIYTCRSINLGIGRYYRDGIFMPALKSSLIYIILWMIFKKFVIPRYFALLMLISCTCLLFILLVFFIGLNTNEKKYFKRAFFGSLISKSQKVGYEVN